MKPKPLNYIKIINTYWDIAPFTDGFKSDYTSLFFALLDSINRNDWQDSEIEYDRITSKAGIGKRMYLEARKWLKESGFITLTEGKGDYQKAKFGLHGAVHFCTAYYTANSTANDTAQSTSNDTSIAPHTAPIYNEETINKETLKQETEVDGTSNDLEDEMSEDEINALNQKIEILRKQVAEQNKPKEEPTPKIKARPPFKTQLAAYIEKNPNRHSEEFYESFTNYWTATDQDNNERWEVGFFNMHRSISNWLITDERIKRENLTKNGKFYNTNPSPTGSNTDTPKPFGGKYHTPNPQTVVDGIRARKEAERNK